MPSPLYALVSDLPRLEAHVGLAVKRLHGCGWLERRLVDLHGRLREGMEAERLAEPEVVLSLIGVVEDVAFLDAEHRLDIREGLAASSRSRPRVMHKSAEAASMDEAPARRSCVLDWPTLGEARAEATAYLRVV